MLIAVVQVKPSCTADRPRARCCGMAWEKARFRHLSGVSCVITILFEIAHELLNLLRWAIILAAIFSMLSSFGVLDSRNRLVYTIGDFLFRITEPVLRPLRRIIPNFGNLDLSPLAAILLISALQVLLTRIYAAIVYGDVQGLFL